MFGIEIFLALSAAGLAWLFYSIYPYYTDRKYRLPPGPTPLPFIGNLAWFGDLKKKPWQALRDLAYKHGPVFTFYLGRYRAVVLGDFNAIQETLVNQAKIFNSRPHHTLPGFETIPSGLIFANYDSWTQRRRFGYRAMRHFGMGKAGIVTKIQDEISHLVPELYDRQGIPFKPRELFSNSVANVICSLVFGRRFSYDDAKFRDLTHSLDVMAARSLVHSTLLMILPPLRHLLVPVQTSDFINFQKAVSKLVNEAIDERRPHFDPDNISDFPDLYLKNEQRPSEDDLDPRFSLKEFGYFMTDMFAAGAETTATALCWTLLMVASYPEMQKKCHEAIDAVIESDRLPTLEDRPKLVYIEAVICETLRHASLVPLSFPHSNLEVATTIGGYEIPPYTMIMCNVTALHYDPKYWTDPEKFNPERWISEDGKLLSHSTNFMPFGIGPRICLGEQLARVEYFLFMVAILHRFSFSLKAPVDISAGILGIVNAPPHFELIAHPR